jgi:hypothetical protein
MVSTRQYSELVPWRLTTLILETVDLVDATDPSTYLQIRDGLPKILEQNAAREWKRS